MADNIRRRVIHEGTYTVDRDGYTRPYTIRLCSAGLQYFPLASSVSSTSRKSSKRSKGKSVSRTSESVERSSVVSTGENKGSSQNVVIITNNENASPDDDVFSESFDSGLSRRRTSG